MINKKKLIIFVVKEIISTIQSIKIMEEQKDKRVLNIELGNEVKKVSITGINSDEKVVMRQELSEDELDQATGGAQFRIPTDQYCRFD